MNPSYEFYLVGQSQLKGYLKENRENLKNLLRHDVRESLLSKGYVPYNPYGSDKYPDDLMVIHPNTNVVIDFSYVYSSYVHLIIGKKRTDSEYWNGEYTLQWRFKTSSFEQFYEKKLKKLEDNG